MNRVFSVSSASAIIGLCIVTAYPAVAQNKMAGTNKPAAKKSVKKKTAVASNVYVCKECMVYYPAAAAKKMGYKDPMHHTLVHVAKAPAGYVDGTKPGNKM